MTTPPKTCSLFIWSEVSNKRVKQNFSVYQLSVTQNNFSHSFLSGRSPTPGRRENMSGALWGSSLNHAPCCPRAARLLPGQLIRSS